MSLNQNKANIEDLGLRSHRLPNTEKGLRRYVSEEMRALRGRNVGQLINEFDDDFSDLEP